MQENNSIKIHHPILYPETIEYKSKSSSALSNYKVLDTHINLQFLLKHFNAKIKFNMMTRRREVYIPEYASSKEDEENSSLAIVTYLATVNHMPITQIDTHLNTLSYENSYHPIVECIKDKPWDGVSRLNEFLGTIKTTNTDLSNKIISAWMVGAIAAAHSIDGYVNHGVLVIHGKQGIGKTAWVRKLDPIGCGAVKEGAFLDPNNKDSIAQLGSYWIAELGELDSIFKKSEIGRLKSFITMEFDYIRLPYAKRPTRLSRRTAYIATVNDENFLSDDTGNRRWWTITATDIDYQHNIDMQQLWAEIYQIWMAGDAITYLSSEIQMEVDRSNELYEKLDPFVELLNTNYDWESTARRRITATDILIELGYTRPTRSDSTRMGVTLKKMTGTNPTRGRAGTQHNVPYLLIKR